MMKELLQLIFETYGFIEKWHDNEVDFYSSENEDKTSFFLIDYIDATYKNVSEKNLHARLNDLENDYIAEGEESKNIKSIIHDLYTNNTNRAAQIDKNISALYVVKLESLKSLDRYKNLIYAVEESPNYYRRYVLPYTDKQITELKNILSNYPGKNVATLLSEIANQEDAYYDLASHKSLENAYELVIRLFSKIPFLQYDFVAVQKPMSVERRIEDSISVELSAYQKLICNECLDVNEYVAIASSIHSEDETSIDEEIERRLGRGKSNAI